jgi:hypothetical protein
MTRNLKNLEVGKQQNPLLRRSKMTQNQLNYGPVKADYSDSYFEGPSRMVRLKSESIDVSKSVCSMSGMIDLTPRSSGNVGNEHEENRKDCECEGRDHAQNNRNEE